jgi:ribonuclease HIII
MAESSYTYRISPEQGERLRAILTNKGFDFAEQPHAHYKASRGRLNICHYTSGKLLLQGKDAHDFIVFTLEPEILGEARLGYEEELNPEMYAPHFGIDESGKGDFFGPLVIAGAYVDRNIARDLAALGVKDSKQIQSDKKARDLATSIRERLGTKFEVITIGPTRYNELYRKFHNLNRLLAWGHAKVIENLHARVPACPRALSDQFAHPSLIERELKAKKIVIELQQRTKAESDIAVAAASILARASFLEKMETLGQDLELTLPKGAGSEVKRVASEIVKKHGPDRLATVAKTHFKTFLEVTSRLNLDTP